MKILLIFDKDFPINKTRLFKFLSGVTTEIKFEIYSKDFSIEDSVITKPGTFNKIHPAIDKIETFDRVFCFTQKQYIDNYFIHEDRHLSIFSLYGWNYLTNLSISNGVIYLIVDYISLDINPTDFRHHETTGCIYDFLWDKRGIDDGMRQARFCLNCLERISSHISDETQLKIFEDLKVLMNELSNASKWNTDILNKIEESTGTIKKRKTKSQDGVNIVIASPGDTDIERRLLLDSLERKFRVDNHEKHCGKRIMVNGWEDLASQNGYAQDVINKKIIESSDFVVAVFKHKLGTPTKDVKTGAKRAESGTSEELLQALDISKSSHPIGMAYFFSAAPVISLDAPDKEKIESEWKRLTEFKKSILDKVIYKPYTEPTDLLSIVLKDLEKNIMDYIEK
ncbi:MAG: hypothetical protein HYZ44_04390 [Bacteroidetes bacterium]|nr:hypothetical protein [Bacteroidota bacterium]